MKIPKILNISSLIRKIRSPQETRKITNLTNELEKFHYNGVEFNTLFKKYPHLSRTVGSLPQKWGRKIGKSQEKREAIDKLFSDFASDFHKINKPNPDLSTATLQNGLSGILEMPVTVEPLAAGSWGRTYKINAESQDYVLKVFFNRAPEVYGSSKHCHGNYNELASAVYASKNCADHFVTFYMGHFGEKQDGYILTKFLQAERCNIKMFNGLAENDSCNFVFSLYLRKLRCWDDSNSNFIAKRAVDFGNTISNAASKLEPEIYKLAKLLGLYLDTNNYKGIDEILIKYNLNPALKEAVAFLQGLINQHCYEKNAPILRNKAKLLDKIGLEVITKESRRGPFWDGLVIPEPK